MCWPFKPKPPVSVFPENKTGYELTFSDEFDKPQIFPNEKWETMEVYGNKETHSLVKNDPPDDYVIWRPSQVKQENGCCVLTNDINDTPGEPQIKAGMIASWKSLVQLYGYFEVKMKVAPNGIDNYSGIWLVQNVWNNEFDIAEFMNPISKQFTSTIHKRVDGIMQQRATKIVTADVDLSLDFHTYGALWEPGRVATYLDNKLVFEYTGEYIPDKTMYLIVQIAVKNSYKPNGMLKFPNSALVDYVRVYKNKLI